MKTMKKHLSILLTAVLLLALLPATAFAAEQTLTVGDSETYKTIQVAVNAIDGTPGTKTIHIKPGIYDEEVQILQKQGIDIVLQGEDGAVFKGNIIIDGDARSSGAGTLTIKNIKFDVTGKTNPATYIIDLKKLSSSKQYSYAHNVTIENCAFVGGPYSYGIQAGSSGGNTAYNTVVKDCTFSGMLGVVNSRCQGLTLENVTATDMGYGLNLQNSSNITLNNVKIYAKGFAFRIGENSTTGGPSGTVLIKNSVLSCSSTTSSEEYGAIIMRTNTNPDIVIESSDVLGHVYSSSNRNNKLIADDVYWSGTTFTGFADSQLDIQNDATISHFPLTGDTEVKASADPTYMVVIPTSVDFGKINRKMSTQTRDFIVAVEDALIEAGAYITVQNKTSPENMVMKDDTGTIELPFTLAQQGGLFKFTQGDLADGSHSITSSVSCDPSQLKAAGSYKGYMTFEINYNK